VSLIQLNERKGKLLMNAMMLEQMKKADIRTINPADLVDIRSININPRKPRDEKIRDYFRQNPNPYFFKVGEIKVQNSYANNGITIDDCMAEIIKKNF
jgi:hypothetical protein